MSLDRVAIVGTGLIGASIGLALSANGFNGEISGWDRDPKQLQIALERGAIDVAAGDPLESAAHADLVVLAGPVLGILDWIEKLGPILTREQLVTDVGSVKRVVSESARAFFSGPNRAGFLPGHPMAGKEVSGAANAEATLFADAVWLFTDFPEHPLSTEWRTWVERFGCRTIQIDPGRHDEVCAWLSHLPQMLATGLSALLEDRFGESADVRAVGGRALREMTRLGASPYSMWRDVAHTNAEEIAECLLSLEQRLAHIRENLKTPELRSEFERANRFRSAGRLRPVVRRT